MKSLLVPTLAAAALLGTGAAQAGNVNWSIGIGVPAFATVVSNVPPPPVVYAPPVVYLPPPVVVRPAPVVYRPAPVFYQPAQVVYLPRRVVYAPVPAWLPPGHWRKHRHGDRDD